jgi:hypothetical protein
MKSRERITDEAADALIAIIRSVTGYDPTLENRDDETIYARQLFYKVFREVKGWSYYRMGAIFGKDHATVRNAVIKLDDLMSYDNSVVSMYNRVMNMFIRSVDIANQESADKAKVNAYIYEKLIEMSELINKQNDYIADLKEEMCLMREEMTLIDKRNLEYRPLIEMVMDRLPKTKIDSALPKIKKILNGI